MARNKNKQNLLIEQQKTYRSAINAVCKTLIIVVVLVCGTFIYSAVKLHDVLADMEIETISIEAKTGVAVLNSNKGTQHIGGDIYGKDNDKNDKI